MKLEDLSIKGPEFETFVYFVHPIEMMYHRDDKISIRWNDWSVTLQNETSGELVIVPMSNITQIINRKHSNGRT